MMITGSETCFFSANFSFKPSNAASTSVVQTSRPLSALSQILFSVSLFLPGAVPKIFSAAFWPFAFSFRSSSCVTAWSNLCSNSCDFLAALLSPSELTSTIFSSTTVLITSLMTSTVFGLLSASSSSSWTRRSCARSRASSASLPSSSSGSGAGSPAAFSGFLPSAASSLFRSSSISLSFCLIFASNKRIAFIISCLTSSLALASNFCSCSSV
mmetsp:Transcript_144721/g.463782  ORF Transcript_144721/g.463782 Transcript_144721/m.463782 type:complete len:213 (-) Transcript_144721:878-1516(-)